MSPDVAGGMAEAVVGGAIASIFWALGLGISKIRNGKSDNGKVRYCDQHHTIIKHLTEVRTDVRWLCETIKKHVVSPSEN